MMQSYTSFILILLPLAFLLEFYAGGFHYRLHPVNLMGKLAALLKNLFYDISNGYFAGVLFNLLTVFVITGISIFLVFILIKFSIIIFYIFFMYILASFLSTGGLRSASLKIYNDLEGSDTANARKGLLSLAGRDSTTLDASGITRATVESIAENTGDGVGSILFYIFLGCIIWLIFTNAEKNTTKNISYEFLYGIICAVIYKTVNLLDSMVGYRNKKYEKFGKFSARLDDFFNYIPFRITALFMLMSVLILGLTGKKYDFKNAFRSWKSFRKDHPSPNAGQLESVTAGALKVKLGGVNFYNGIESKRPVLGFDYYNDPDKKNIVEAILLMELTSVLLIIFYTTIIYLISISYIV